jgi:hypothetical protein
MFGASKYVVGEIRDGLFKAEVAICFPDTISHANMARRLFDGSPTSAGFFSIDGNVVSAYGESTSLGLKSNPEKDVQLIRRSLCIDL